MELSMQRLALNWMHRCMIFVNELIVILCWRKDNEFKMILRLLRERNL